MFETTALMASLFPTFCMRWIPHCFARRWAGVWILVWAWIYAVAAAPGAQAAEVPLVVLSQAAGGTSLVGKLGFLEDPDGTLEIAQVRTPGVDARFTVPPITVQQSGLDLHARWFKIRLRQDGTRGAWLIDSNTTALRQFSAYGPFDAKGNALAAPWMRSVTEAPTPPALEGDRFVYRFELDQPGDYTIYLRTVSDFPEYYRFAVWDAIQFGEAEQSRSLFNGICYGLLIGMLVYNLMLLFVFREALYAFNFFACLFAMGTLVTLNGHTARYLLADAREWVPNAMVAMPPLWIAFATLFGLSFLELSRYTPRLARCLLTTVPVCAVALCLALVGEVLWSLALTQAMALVVPVLMFTGAVLALRSGFQPAAWYMVGLSMLFAAYICTTLNNFGVLSLPFHYEALQVGIVVEITVFVVALGSRIRRMCELNGELGQRTQQLTRAAQTDALTGLFNRAGWLHYAPLVLAQGGQAALLLIDLDRFKPVNDAYGHAAGDKVLVTVARRLLADARAQGIVARLGGDEFVVLLSDVPSTEALATHAQRLVRLVSQPVIFNGIGLKVGASIGIACYPVDGEDLGGLMHAADLAMYGAKERGRAGYAFAADVHAAVPIQA